MMYLNKSRAIVWIRESEVESVEVNQDFLAVGMRSGKRHVLVPGLPDGADSVQKLLYPILEDACKPSKSPRKNKV